ncbi:NYN domain-containing protein [Lipingzhangella sp. LS1_29]|uniref:NYN domain-containing protein n=1 Tax=Lipingzhangella rawalii TaxID=2055835 RepID=A0ABU2H130_9ACTN|nr:NYN domain-containing protein [Lipingzhangella rawalii]MDS1268697.1 NYN domain-containing protein [Lipingzhangella rawalii]
MRDAQATTSSGEDPDGLGRPLAPAVRERVVDHASATLQALPQAEIPAALRQVARFEPKRRARLAGGQIAAQLEKDPVFRAAVTQQLSEEFPEVVAALREGTTPAAADPVTVAAVAYLVRGPDWVEIVTAAETELRREEEHQAEREAQDSLRSLQKKVDDTRRQAREEQRRLRSELRTARSTIADLRRAAHAERTRARRAEDRAEQVEQETQGEVSRLREELAAARAENRRLRERLETAQSQADSARQAAKAGRSAEDARLRVLLEVLQGAAHGLWRELDLPSTIERPADLVAEVETATGKEATRGERERGQPATTAPMPAAGRPDDDPGLLDEVLRMPQVHLLVDGYNVTKSAHPEMTLQEQREWLLAGLEGLAARTRAEITCVFDGANMATPVPTPPSRRRVRLLFSAAEETADTLIIRMVRAEPAGRPIAVVSSDAEIASTVRRAGARALPSAVLARGLRAATN